MRDPGAKIVQVSTGNTFSLFLSDSGQVYAAGSSEAGQLGNGKTGQSQLTIDLGAAWVIGIGIELRSRRETAKSWESGIRH